MLKEFLHGRRAAVSMFALLALAALMVSACVAPVAAPAEEGTVPAAEEASPDAAPTEAMMEEAQSVQSITLPDGTECLNAGEGATLAFDGQRVNYNCATTDEGEVVLLGDLQSPQLDILIVNQGLVTHGADGFSLAESAELTLRMTEVTLADGTLCLNAGQGATASFNDARVNYTCETTDEGDIVLAGDFVADGTTLMVEKGLLMRSDDGFTAGESEMQSVTAVVTEAAE